MKRLLIILFVLVFIAAIPLSHNLMAKGKKADKVEICHVTPAMDEVILGSIVIHYGKVIKVSGNAVEAHVKHGDMPAPGFFYMSEEARDSIEEDFGVNLLNANCGFVVQ